MNEEVLSRLLKWSKGNKAPPEMVQIYPTNKCNLRCVFCYQQLKEYDLNDIVPHNRWFEIVKEICEMGVREILISGGGEPLAEPELTLGIMKIVKDYELNGRLINNGTLWSKRTIEDTIEMMWDNVMFSVDGSDSKTHDYLRGVDGCFKTIIKNIKLFNETKKRFSKEKPTLELTTVLCRENYDKVSDIIKLADSVSINHVNFEPICVNNPETKKLKLNKNERKVFFKEILPKAQKLADSIGVHTNFSKLRGVKYIEKTGELKEFILNNNDKIGNPFLSLPCYECWLWPKIEANGEVWPCTTLPLKVNIRNKSFKEIWYGEEFKKIRNKIMKRDLPDSCNNCVSTHLPVNKKIRELLKEKFNVGI